MTDAVITLYLAGLFGAYFGGYTWGVTSKFIRDIGRVGSGS